MTVVELRPGQAALFGYGSLCSLQSLERTLGRAYEGPFAHCSLRGWRRSWTLAMPNDTFYAETVGGRLYPRHVLYLDIEREPRTSVNGVLFVVDPPDVANFDQREWIYDRVEIGGDLDGVSVHGGPAYAYVGRAEHRMVGVRSPEVAAVRATYLQILEDAFAAHGPGFRRAYERSTAPLPEHLVIEDRT